MQGRGHGSDPSGRAPHGRGRFQGRGRGNQTPSNRPYEAKFKGANPDLPALSYGGAAKDNRPIEFLRLIGEHCAMYYKASIAQVFWTNPPVYGAVDPAPVLPDIIPDGPIGQALISEFVSDKKEHKIQTKKLAEQKQAIFAMTLGQLNESSRSEVQDDEGWTVAYTDRNLIYLVTRIRATHIAIQSGNPSQDKERVRLKWLTLKMGPQETGYQFRIRVEEYQIERVSVGLAVIPEDELVIGLLNRFDMQRYAHLVTELLGNERRGIADLPDSSAALWKEIKDAQVIRYRGGGTSSLETVYLSNVDDTHLSTHGRGRGGRGRGGRTGRTGRGRGRGRVTAESSHRPRLQHPYQ